MKKIISKSFLLVLVLQFTLTSQPKAQVYNGTLSLLTQADVDAFNYTSVTGNLLIGGLFTNITNLNGLSELTSVGGTLIINPTVVLNSISGLSGLTSVGGDFTINGDLALTSINGLSGLTTVGGTFTIQTASSVTSLGALSNLHSINGLVIKQTGVTNIDVFTNLTVSTLTGSIIIDNNDALTNLDGLTDIHVLTGNLKIVDNLVLASGEGLSNLTSVGGNLDIEENPALPDLDWLSNLTHVGKDLTIEKEPLIENLDGLNSLVSVIGGFSIFENDALTSISGLSHVTSIGGDLNISGDPLLTNIDGLSGLTSLGGGLILSGDAALKNIDGLSNVTSINGGVLFLTDPVLNNIDGFSKLTSVGKGLSIVLIGALTNLDKLANLTSVGDFLIVRQNPLLTDFCGLYNLFNTGTIGGNIQIVDNGANTVSITPPAEVNVSNDPGKCSAVIADIGVPTVDGCLKPGTATHSDLPSGNIFPVDTTLITWSVTDAAGNTATTTQKIIVVDNEKPTITCPNDTTVSCASDIPPVDINSVKATDNCSYVVTHVSDDTTNKTCANRFTLTRTYKATDPANNTATCSQTITVYDNTPPEVTNLSASLTALWPPNHTMRDITISYTVTDNCNNLDTTLSVSSSEPDNGIADGDTSPDWEIIDKTHVRLRAERAANGTGRVYTITVTVTDGCNDAVSKSAQVMVVHNITGPLTGRPFRIGSSVDFAGDFWDKITNKHTAKWLIDGNTSVKGTVVEPTTNKNGKAAGTYKFNNAGVYKLQMNITDQTGITSFVNTNGDLEEIIVIYDPNGGYTYGGGWFNSPAGALKSNPNAIGKVSYGFSMNYFKGATLPKGETQFEFKIGNFEFNAVNFDYLVISGAKAQFKGTGKIIGGPSGINFIMTVIDGDLDGTSVDKIRVKIYNKNTGQVYYDNQPGASDAATPITAVGLNSSIIVQNTNITAAQKEVIREEAGIVAKELEVKAIPNPSNDNFTLTVRSDNRKDKIVMQVIDMYGRMIETRNVAAEQTILLGDKYRSGTYIVKLIQGGNHKELKLVKL